MIELSGDGTYWNINTAGVFKPSYGRNNKEVYIRHTTDNQPTEADGVSQGTEQSGTTEPSGMNTPIPEGKDNTLQAEKQVDVKKSSTQGTQSEIDAASADVLFLSTQRY